MIMKENNGISLSVIVPCYNVERYLELSLRCLERQWNGRNDYEIILVNDASTDNTLEKLIGFQQRYPDNVIVINKRENEGVAAARNSGLDIAQGKWIVFFDPDDALVDGGYSQLLAITEKEEFDILSFGVSVDAEGVISEVPVRIDINVDWRGTSQDYLMNQLFGTSLSFFYKRSILNDRRFPIVVVNEDLLFVVPVFLGNHVMVRTEAKVYHYIVHVNSAAFVSSDYKRMSRQCDDIIKVVETIESFKDGQPEPIRLRLLKRQQFFVHNMSNRLLVSNKNKNEINLIVHALERLQLFPLLGNGKMTRIINYVFTHLWILPVFRPMYRLFRRIYNKIYY